MATAILDIYRPVKPGPFVLASLILHGLFITVFSYYYVRTSASIEPPKILNVRIQPRPLALETRRRDKPQPTVPDTIDKDTPATEDSAFTTTQHQDMWHKGIATLHELLQQPGFLEQLEPKESLIPNYRSDLFNKNDTISQTTIETFTNRTTGEVLVVFRYPSGKKICARVREPDPMIPFDTGAWLVVLNGC